MGALYGAGLLRGGQKPATPLVALPATLTPAPTPIPSEWVSPNGEREHEYVKYEGGYIAGALGHPVELFNNREATNPSWLEPKDFLEKDKTDQHDYSRSSFVCADFAETLHNNAEKAGIRAAYVVVKLQGNPDFGDTIHVLDAFNTTDEGLVFIDDTKPDVQGSYLDYANTRVVVKVGWQYVPQPIFPCGFSSWERMGLITDIYI